MTLEKRCEDLKSSPLFALSLCSKELAHSNFWDWMIDEIKVNGNHPFAGIFIDGEYTFEKVKREEGHRDITIYYSDSCGKQKCIFVENKIKTLPTCDQLDNYRKKYKNDTYELQPSYLTGIIDTLDDSIPDGWTFMSYSEIAKRIESINENNKTKYYKIIKKYTQDLTNISEVVSKYLNEEYKNAYCIEAPENLNKIRLSDIFLKFKADEIKLFFEKKIKENDDVLISDWGEPVVEAGFNHAKTTITVIYKQPKEIKTKTGELGRIGVQLEGKQFRIYAGPSSRKSPLYNPDALYEKLKEIKWLDDWKYGDDVCGHKTSMEGGRKKLLGKPFCGYFPDDYLHIYHYWDIDDKVKLYDLWNCVKLQLIEAKEIIDLGKLSF